MAESRVHSADPALKASSLQFSQMEKVMHLDTESLKAKIESEVSRIEGQKENLLAEIQKLESEQDRLNETFEAVEAVERTAKELEVLSHLSDASEAPVPEQEQAVVDEAHPQAAEPAYSEASNDSMIQDFKQWA